MSPECATTTGAEHAPEPAAAPPLRRALALLRAGRRGEAAALCRGLLEHDPTRRHALLLLGTLAAEDGNVQAAEALFTRALALDPQDVLALHNLAKLRQRQGDDASAVPLFEQALALHPDFAPGRNDLGVSLHRLGRREAALAAFARAIAIDPAYAVAHGNRGRVLLAAGRSAEAAAAFERETILAPRSAEAWHHLALARDAQGDLAAAEAALRQALALAPGETEAHFHLASVLDRRHRPEQAMAAAVAGARRQGIAVKRCRGGSPEARILVLGAAGAGNLPVRALFDDARFEIVAAHLLPPGADPDGPAALLEGLPPCDVVFNAMADPDRGAAFLDATETVCRRLGRPLLNPPAQVRRTRRDLGPALLAGIPRLSVPKTRRVTGADIARGGAALGFALPLLIRPCGSHGGAALERLDHAADLAAYLARVPSAEFYLTDYRDFRSADGYWRKYRLIFIDREVFPYHLAIARDWMIHYWRVDMSEDWMKREEVAFLADYRSVFADDGAAVREAARRLDLDYGGMDCAVTRDGRVLVFEANASMLVHLDDSREAFAYKHAHVPRIVDAMTALVLRRRANPELPR
jgi:tetratricopeptide (TPR) repeat protein/glutathione synthase/RimK-type ligase-like ATP-grasp enzyme